MKHVALVSTNLKSAGYEDETLEISFVKGKVYQYLSVPFTVYQGLLRAPSAGAYFDQNIRGKYGFKIVSTNGGQPKRR